MRTKANQSWNIKLAYSVESDGACLSLARVPPQPTGGCFEMMFLLFSMNIFTMVLKPPNQLNTGFLLTNKLSSAVECTKPVIHHEIMERFKNYLSTFCMPTFCMFHGFLALGMFISHSVKFAIIFSVLLYLLSSISACAERETFST